MTCRSPRGRFTAGPTRAPSKRVLWDVAITQILAGYCVPDDNGRREPESPCGSLKMWAHLQREGIPVAKSTVERLLRRNGWQGVRRCKRVRTTVPDPAGDCPGLQRCPGHFVRNVLAQVPKRSAEMVAATIRTIFAQPEAEHVRE